MRSEFSNRKALLGSLVGPLAAMIAWPTHDAICIGPFVLFTFACWLILFLRGREMFRNISGR